MDIQKQKRIRDMWNMIFSVIFVLLVVGAVMIIASTYGRMPTYIPFFELAIIVLALFRLTRLFVYDAIMAFARDLFLDVSYTESGEIVREKYAYGFKRSISDILSCPWCFSVWASIIVLTLYVVGDSVFFFILLFLALSGVATLIQLSANLLGWSAEKKKLNVKKMEKEM